MKHSARKQAEHSWPKTLIRKWLNISSRDSDFSADEGDNDSDFDDDEDWEREMQRERTGAEIRAKPNYNRLGSMSYKSRRRNSETLRAQYIDTKEVRICVGTWNVGGKLPPNNLDIEEWLDIEEPADIYVLGLQEIVPLNAGNVLGAEDSRSVPRWESLIRDTLNRIQLEKPKYKCYSDPPSPSRFKPSDDDPASVDELLPETDSDSDDEVVHPAAEESFSFLSENDESASLADDFKCNLASTQSSHADTDMPQDLDLQTRPTVKRLNRCHGFSLINYEPNSETLSVGQQKMLTRTLSKSERIGLVWPEQSLDLLAKCTMDNPNTFRSVKSFRAYNSFKSVHGECVDSLGLGLIPEFNRGAVMYKRKRLPFIRIVSKQMVGIFLSIWVRRNLRKYIQNLKVSTVGVGIMGYIGNKGSVSVSMSIYQTPFCFICSHLSSGEKNGDELRRNADVQEIHRRTRFSTVPSPGLPQAIHDHERIFWFGDLNYRINLSYEKTHELISKKKWSELAERDQLRRELKKGCVFDGWSEGVVKFPPTYKYEFSSEKYIGEDLKAGKRTPAWCDRVLSFGSGVKQLNYRRSELKMSDHRPVTATFMAEVEVFCHRKLQKALTLTDAEIEDGEITSEMDFAVGMSSRRIGQEVSEWGVGLKSQ